MKKAGIPSDAIRGYDRVVKTHSKAAALGPQAAAGQHRLDFIPLFEERYDLILPREKEKVLTPLLDYLQTVDFHRVTESLTGYSALHSGEQISLYRES